MSPLPLLEYAFQVVLDSSRWLELCLVITRGRPAEDAEKKMKQLYEKEYYAKDDRQVNFST